MTTCPSCKYSVSRDALKCPNRSGALAVLILTGWAFHTSLGGQKLFAGGLLDE